MIKYLVKSKMICRILSLIVFFNMFFVNVYADERDNQNIASNITLNDAGSILTVDKKTPYFVDQYGNVLDVAPNDGPYVQVLYDSRWDESVEGNASRAGTTAYQYININGIVLRGASGGHYSVSWYNTTINVGMYVYFNTSTLQITSVSNATVLYTNCPLMTSHSNAWISASAYGGRANVTGYITYYEPYRETLTGTGSWGF